MTGPAVIQLEAGAVYLPAASVQLLAALAARGLRDAGARDGVEPVGARALVAELVASVSLGMPKPELLGSAQIEAPSAVTVAPVSDGHGDGWMGTAAAAELLGCSAELVRQLVAADRLPGRKDSGGAWRLRRTEVIAYMQRRDERRSIR